MKSTRYANITSTLALVFAIATGGAYAVDKITSSDIPPNTIKSSDLAKNSVRSPDLKASAVQSSDIKTGAVTTSDIGEGQVEPVDVTAPTPGQLTVGAGVAPPLQGSSTFQQVATAGGYTKSDPTSLLEVAWTGTASAEGLACIFQLRIDGQPSGGAVAEVFVPAGGAISVSATALFAGLAEGPHTVSVWARNLVDAEGAHTCTVGPAGPGITQTFVVSEVVV